MILSVCQFVSDTVSMLVIMSVCQYVSDTVVVIAQEELVVERLGELELVVSGERSEVRQLWPFLCANLVECAGVVRVRLEMACDQLGIDLVLQFDALLVVDG